MPYVFLLAYYSWQLRVNGFADLTAWDLAWRSPLAKALHSFVSWSIVAFAVVPLCGVQRRRAILPILAGWLSHIVIDMLTHRSDGYPIFYPLSAYRFPAPISYWEPAYHGQAFMLVDTTCMLLLSVRHLATRVRRRRFASHPPALNGPLTG